MITRNLKDFINTITVDSNLEDIFSKDREVLDSIEQDLINNGTLIGEPFYINKRPDGTEVLIDGHTKRQGCLNQIEHIKEDAEVLVIVLDLLDSTAEELWVRTHQIKRRNLSDQQTTSNKLAIGRLYNQTKKARGGNYGNQHTELPNEKSGVLPTGTVATSQNMGKELGLSERTIRNYAKLDNLLDEMAENLAPKKLDSENTKTEIKQELVEAIETGKVSQNTITEMAKKSGSSLYKEKVKKALKEEDINSAWKGSRSIAPSPKPVAEKTDTLESAKPGDDIITNAVASDGVNDLTDDQLVKKEETSTIELVERSIKLLADKEPLEEDGATPSDTALFFHRVAAVVQDYFTEHTEVLSIILGEKV